jgi:hypothetical protein
MEQMPTNESFGEAPVSAHYSSIESTPLNAKQQKLFGILKNVSKTIGF